MKKERKETEAEILSERNILRTLLERRGLDESIMVQNIDNLKRIIRLQCALRYIIREWDDYSESVDEQPNQWLVTISNIAEKALGESTKTDVEFEIRNQVKEMANEISKLKQDNEELQKLIKI